MNRGRAVGLVAACAMAALLVGCGGGVSAADGKLIPVTTVAGSGGLVTTSTTSPTSTTTEPPSTTTTTTLPVIPGVDPALEQTVWTAYLAAWGAIDDASLTSDPDSPALAQHLTNSSLDGWKQILAQRRTDGQYAFYRPTSRHTDRLYGMTVKYPNWIDIDTCQYDDGVVAVKQTGAVVADAANWTRFTATMWRVGDVWYLAGSTGQGVEEAQCPTS